MLLRDKVVIASHLVTNLGVGALTKMETIVEEHENAGDIEGAAFWREIAEAIRIVSRIGQQSSTDKG